MGCIRLSAVVLAFSVCLSAADGGFSSLPFSVKDSFPPIDAKVRSMIAYAHLYPVAQQDFDAYADTVAKQDDVFMSLGKRNPTFFEFGYFAKSPFKPTPKEITDRYKDVELMSIKGFKGSGKNSELFIKGAISADKDFDEKDLGKYLPNVNASAAILTVSKELNSADCEAYKNTLTSKHNFTPDAVLGSMFLSKSANGINYKFSCTKGNSIFMWAIFKDGIEQWFRYVLNQER
ncbi:MAG: hypothetical protein LBQ18_04960 [Campylobacteraceae bacterium]|jgi:hypothetical protein|nr:hypothetical protein [Campylobacteraceae bacterium]